MPRRFYAQSDVSRLLCGDLQPVRELGPGCCAAAEVELPFRGALIREKITPSLGSFTVQFGRFAVHDPRKHRQYRKADNKQRADHAQ